MMDENINNNNENGQPEVIHPAEATIQNNFGQNAGLITGNAIMPDALNVVITASEHAGVGNVSTPINMQSVEKNLKKKKHLRKLLICMSVVFSLFVGLMVFIALIGSAKKDLVEASYKTPGVNMKLRYLKNAKIVTTSETGTGALAASKDNDGLQFLSALIPNDHRFTLTLLTIKGSANDLGGCGGAAIEVASISGNGKLCVKSTRKNTTTPISYLYETSKNNQPYTSLISFDFDATNPSINDRAYRDGIFNDMGGNLDQKQIEEIVNSIDIQ